MVVYVVIVLLGFENGPIRVSVGMHFQTSSGNEIYVNVYMHTYVCMQETNK